jgi:hypothetical protein
MFLSSYLQNFEFGLAIKRTRPDSDSPRLHLRAGCKLFF